MSHWQNLTIEERQVILNNVARVENLPPAAIEKDWWVTSVLNAVFRTDAASSMLFKGGTSLSKAWHIIERLSEDVDLAIDHSFFGVNSTNKNQRDKLRKLSRKYIMETLAEQLDLVTLSFRRQQYATTLPSSSRIKVFAMRFSRKCFASSRRNSFRSSSPQSKGCRG